MTRNTAFLGVLLGFGLHTTAFGEIINVPGDQPTIQGAIDAAAHGDQIVVAPGTYFENISLHSKAVMLRSSGGREVTTIDAQGSGSVIIDPGSTTVIDGFTITGGSATLGGGMHIFGSSPTVINCTFSGNSADAGGAMSNVSGSPTVTNCTFIGNQAADNGGAMFNIGSSAPRITNCTFSGNTGQSGGGMFNGGTSPFVTNCTFSGNTAVSGGAIHNGGVYNQGGGPTISNCILWNNSPNQIVDTGGAKSVMRYSNVQGGWPGEGNIDADPLFADPDHDDYHLPSGSPCVDAGNNLAVPHGVVGDLDGFARFADDPDTRDTGNGGLGVGMVDMGPYEFGADDCNNNGTLDLDETAAGDAADCDDNSIPDQCQPDCNENGQADTCDLTDETGADCNNNANPDECDIDCNADPDGCDTDCNINGIPDACDIADGTSLDCQGTGVSHVCCPSDFDGDGTVDPLDLATLLGAWGACPAPCIPGVPTCVCQVDFNYDCSVGPFDLAMLLGAWGPCP